MRQTTLYLFQAAILIGCSQSLRQLEEAPTLKTEHLSGRKSTMQTEDNSNVTFKVTGTVTQINIADVSKTKRVQNFRTYLTVKVEETQPANVLSNLSSNELKFSWVTDRDRDQEIKIGDQIEITVVGNDYTDTTWFRVYDLRKIRQ